MKIIYDAYYKPCEENTIFIYLDGIFFDEVVDLIIPCECEWSIPNSICYDITLIYLSDILSNYRPAMAHTILLVQPGIKPETRTYSDYESVNECMEGVCKIYEEHLKRTNPNLPSITYDISQLFDFIDQVRLINISNNY